MTIVKLNSDTTKPEVVAKEVVRVIQGIPAADGDGVQLTRIIGSPDLNQLDPFLLFDAFGSDQPQEYIGGFPPHPHRGFETVTYMLAGKMRHKDSTGRAGVIETGGVQWMTAGRGIIHSEMPEQTEGLLAGFQLWVNLPAEQKMTPPNYQEFSADKIPLEVINNPHTGKSTGTIKVIAGDTGSGIKGAVKNDFVKPFYWDVNLTESFDFHWPVPANHNSFIYVIEGEVLVGAQQKPVSAKQMAVLGEGDKLTVRAKKSTHAGSRFLFISAQPLNEPVERAGPFVMNTREQINQAFADYQAGRLA
ncbi:pirin family protein [Aliikangiella maris]|uniref:Pirin family protein n=2 Tax=Aliikangiella maris TaxID=3162458 RepID=A0ABV2BQR4_9GAMM